MPPLTEPRWERFALAYFSGKSKTESAKIAGISRRSATRLAQNGAVLARIKELQEAAANDKVMGVVQRKVRLSEMARGHDCPIQAIAELNRMEGVYASVRVAKSVAANVTPRCEIIVVPEKARPSTER
jgi:phage terminase small subunit